jgi:glutamate-1-semialdehyde 2,1-aminomutase
MNAIEADYRQRTPMSAQIQRRAEHVMPGGDTRTSVFHQPYPLTITCGNGAFIWDADGNRYIDLLGNYTSLVHGHAYPPIVEAIVRAARSSTAWAARSHAQVQLAELLCERIESVKQVRFCNSGSEAGMLAAKLARHVTGRKLLLVARQGYHGSFDDLESGLVKANGERTLFADFGNSDQFERILRERGDQIAAVFVEPVLGAGGIIQPPADFLSRIVYAAHRAGALLVLDEVITLRLSPGGAQELFALSPDLTMMGKIIGGGLPVGAVGGSNELMAGFDPLKSGSLHHSGTFNGNPLTCAAGVASMTELTAPRITIMEAQARRLAAELEREARRLELRMSLRQAGSLMNVAFVDESPEQTARLYRDFHLACLNHGVFIAPRGLLALSTAINDELLTEICERMALALRDAGCDP